MDNNEKIALLRKLHEPYFKSQNIDPYYRPKMAYKPTGFTEKCISMFESELTKNVDIYTEFVSRTYVSEDKARTLYKLKHNPFWKEEYVSRVSQSGFTTYLVPVSELIKIKDNNTKPTVFSTKSVKDSLTLTKPEDAFSLRAIVVNLDRIATALEKISNKN